MILSVFLYRQRELDVLHTVKAQGSFEDLSGDISIEIYEKFVRSIKEKNTGLDVLEPLAQEAANSLTRTLNVQLERINYRFSEKSSWEERSVVSRLSQKLQKYQRNKRWKKKRRKLIAEMISKVC